MTTTANGFAEIIDAGVEGDVFETADRVNGGVLADLLTGWADPGRRGKARVACARKAAGFTIEKNVSQTLDILLQAR